MMVAFMGASAQADENDELINGIDSIATRSNLLQALDEFDALRASCPKRSASQPSQSHSGCESGYSMLIHDTKALINEIDVHLAMKNVSASVRKSVALKVINLSRFRSRILEVKARAAAVRIMFWLPTQQSSLEQE
ncbi:MAG: hypothetical protein NUV59_03450 [Patescibacteria group bacterium]|nr:hypothetical protein [Patescibacteria group bacterium]